MSKWEQLRRDLGRASDSLRKMRDGLNRHGPEWQRLNGKVQGVDHALSVMDEIERMARL